jgi:hypothetical protein
VGATPELGVAPGLESSESRRSVGTIVLTHPSTAPAPLVIGPAEVFLVGPSPPETSAVRLAAPPALVIGPPEPIVIGPSEPALVIGPTSEPSTVIEPPQRGAWDEQGWTVRTVDGQKIYEGAYQVRNRRMDSQLTYRGRVRATGTNVIPYIADPPPEIQRHPKGPCFILARAPWFRVYWHRPAQNVDDAILYVEKVLDEAINAR